jgi:hypothetical protein
MEGINPFDEDALTRYVLEHYRNLLTETEDCALRAIYLDLKRMSAESHSVHRKPGDVLERMTSPAVVEMLALGPEKCRRTIRDRVLRDHSQEILLLTCPKCKRLARTPHAKMCVHCGHAWHVLP